MVSITPLSQMDPRWKSKPLGFDSITIGDFGCLMTSMTMVANYYGFNETPDTVNEKMKKVGGFQGALIIPGAFPAALPGMTYRNFINCESTPAPMAEIDAYLAEGKPVIVEVDYSPNAGLQNHWIVLSEKRGNDYLLVDPWPFPAQNGEVALLTSRYKFAGSPDRIIKGVVFLEGQRKLQEATPQDSLSKVVTASFPVYANADGLALRSETLVADYTLIKRVPMGTKLTMLESDAAVNAKLGVLNQWLAVQDPTDNSQGYAAAWYLVKTAPGTATPPPPAPQPADKPLNLIVKTIEEGVALRSQPVISDASLVRRVPVNTELVCTEPYDQANAKVGVVYQWLKVRDVTSCEYYVAAWYVKAVNGQATLGPRNQANGASFALPTEEVEPTIVRAAVEGLAFRTLPLIMKETLIKRLPVDGELVALEDPSLADPKIGKMGEWLHVRDVAGDEGYVAAWYVVKRPELAIDETKPLLG